MSMEDFEILYYKNVLNSSELSVKASQGYNLLNLEYIPSEMNIIISLENHLKNPAIPLIHHLSPFKSSSKTLKYFGINDCTRDVVYIKQKPAPLLEISGNQVEYSFDVSAIQSLLKLDHPNIAECMLSMAATKHC